MGQPPTLPPNQQATPYARRDSARRGDHDLDLAQPPPVPATPAATPKRPSYCGIPLDGTAEQLHRATDLLEADTVPYGYYAKVIANQRQREQEPLGRRAPAPLDAAREGVER